MERGDIYLDGLLVQTQATAPIPAPVAVAVKAPAPAPEPAPAFKTKARRSKPELEDLKGKLIKALQEKGSLSSFEAQVALDLKECDWAPATPCSAARVRKATAWTGSLGPPSPRA